MDERPYVKLPRVPLKETDRQQLTANGWSHAAVAVVFGADNLYGMHPDFMESLQPYLRIRQDIPVIARGFAPSTKSRLVKSRSRFFLTDIYTGKCWIASDLVHFGKFPFYYRGKYNEGRLRHLRSVTSMLLTAIKDLYVPTAFEPMFAALRTAQARDRNKRQRAQKQRSKRRQ